MEPYPRRTKPSDDLDRQERTQKDKVGTVQGAGVRDGVIGGVGGLLPLPRDKGRTNGSWRALANDRV